MSNKITTQQVKPLIATDSTFASLPRLHEKDVSLLTFDPYTTLFCRNGKVSLQQGLLSQRFSLLVAIDWFFAMKIVLWP
jgi:hypothetical protein